MPKMKPEFLYNGKIFKFTGEYSGFLQGIYKLGKKRLLVDQNGTPTLFYDIKTGEHFNIRN